MTAALQVGLFVATIVCAVANAVVVAGKVVRAKFVLRNTDEVGVPRTWIPLLAILEGAGVVGLLVGLLTWPLIGLAAAFGLVSFFVVAVGAHVRARVFHSIGFPALFLGLAGAAACYFAWFAA